MNEFDRQLQALANELSQVGHDKPAQLLALTYTGFRAWAKVGNLSFPPERRYELLQEVLRFCADESLCACCFSRDHALQKIADMLDGSYPRYARTRARIEERRNRYGRIRF
ncbi:hypothetical protein [Cupriavidus sp. H39]|uniref:hypothetical protein n=1 Tax=Cupriavidus sp. H39 TaxID=3401635 RepID=UPI003CFC275E